MFTFIGRKPRDYGDISEAKENNSHYLQEPKPKKLGMKAPL